MVHKMQRMALSSHSLVPANKPNSENTRNSEKTDSGDGAEEEVEKTQGDGLPQTI